MSPLNLSMRAVLRIAVTAIACTAVLVPVIALAAPGQTVSPRSAAGTPACETPGLVIWLDTNGNAAAGSTFFKLQFTNLSGHKCTLNGFPFLFAVNLRGRQLGKRASFDRGTSPHSVTLGKGKTATAVLQIVQVLNFPRSACHPVTAAGFKVFPPNQTRAKIVPFPFGACSRRGPTFLSVRPVK